MTGSDVESPPRSSSRLYADDLHVGARFELGSWTVSHDEIRCFATQWDPLPIHTDDRAAAEGPFGGVIASGIHTLAVMQRLSVEGLYSRTAITAGRGIQHAKLAKPVRAGTTLHGTVSIQRVRIRDRGDAIVTTCGQLHDDEGELVIEMIGESVWETSPENR